MNEKMDERGGVRRFTSCSVSLLSSSALFTASSNRFTRSSSTLIFSSFSNICSLDDSLISPIVLIV